MREVAFGQDGSYSHEAIVNRINADLANDLGNLAQRSLSMIARNCDGRVPTPSRLLGGGCGAVRAKRMACRRALRAAMDQLALHVALADIWSVVAAANRYFASEEPWVKRKSAPDRFATILYVTLETLRAVGIVTQPFIPGAAAKLLDLLGVSTDRRQIEGYRNGGAARSGKRASGAGPDLSSLCRARAQPCGAVMLVDSHCHLDFPDLAADEAGVLARARAAGVGRFLTISTRVRRNAALQAISARHDDVFFTVGTHPHHAAEEAEVTTSDIVALSAHPRCVGIGEAGLDYHYDRSPRDVQDLVFRKNIAAARETGLAPRHPCA